MAKENMSLESLFAKPAGSSNYAGRRASVCSHATAESKGKKNTFIINEDVQIRFNNYIKRSGTKRAVIVNQALTEFLDKHERV